MDLRIEVLLEADERPDDTLDAAECFRALAIGSVAKPEVVGQFRPVEIFDAGVAGVWTEWTSVRKVKEGESTNELFAFLTTDANAVVAPIHPKAMPVILTTVDEFDIWLSAPAEEALVLQRPLPDDALRIVARGERSNRNPA